MLTSQTIANLHDGYIWDPALVRGYTLGVRSVKLSKYFVIRYRCQGKEHKKTIGRVGEISLALARQLAVEMRAALIAAPPDRFPTVQEAFDAYLSIKSGTLKQDTIKDYRVNFNRYLNSLAGVELNKLTPTHVIAFYQELMPRSHAKANYSLRLLSAIYNAHNELDVAGLKVVNPVSRLRALGLEIKLSARKRLIAASQLVDWWKALSKVDRDPQDYCIVALLLGFRRKVLCRMTWHRFDATKRTYRLTSSEAKNKEGWDYPLSPYATALIEARRTLPKCEGDYIFPGQKKGTHASGYDGSITALAGHSGVTISAHDLRRTRATIAGSLGLSTIMLKRLLTHKLDAAPTDASVTGDYVLSDTDGLRPHVEAVERTILQLARVPLDVYRVRIITSEDIDEIDLPIGDLLTKPSSATM